jgi:hypothetical protein
VATEPRSLDRAKELRDEWSSRITQECSDCVRANHCDFVVAAQAAMLSVKEFAESDGWTNCSDRCGFLKRCSACTDARMYAWIRRIDLERIQTWMDAHPNPFDLNELKALL